MAKETNGTELASAEDIVKHIRLSDIFVDPVWNARSLANVMAEQGTAGDQEGSGITGLVNGIAARGQDTPVKLRPTAQPFYASKAQGFTGQPFALVSGFRRFEAIRRLNDNVELVKTKNAEGKTVVPNTANGTIRAYVVPMTEKEARIENTAENAFREDLDPPDLVHAVGRMSSAPLNMSAVDISVAIGKTTGYVTVLQRVAGLHKDVLTHWREGGEFQGVKNVKRVPIEDLVEIAKLDKDRHCAEYKRVLESKPGIVDGKRDKQWMAAAKKAAERVGKFLGTLERHEIITVDQSKPWVDCLTTIDKKPLLMKVHSGTKAGDRRKLADILEKAYQEALEATDEEAGVTEADEDEGGSSRVRGRSVVA